MNISPSITPKVTPISDYVTYASLQPGYYSIKRSVIDNCFKGNIRFVTAYFHVLSYLCEYLLELLELSESIWFSFHPCAFYSFILLRVHSIRTSFISHLLNLLQSTKI